MFRAQPAGQPWRTPCEITPRSLIAGIDLFEKRLGLMHAWDRPCDQRSRTYRVNRSVGVKRLRDSRLWLRIPEAARYLSVTTGEHHDEADVLRAALDEQIKLVSGPSGPCLGEPNLGSACPPFNRFRNIRLIRPRS